METKLHSCRMERVRKRCEYVSGIDVAAMGSKGCLTLAWKGDININLRSYSLNHIDVLVKDNTNTREWRFTGFYGSPIASGRMVMWDLLRRLGQDQGYPWLVCGDFNEIL